MRHRTAWLSLAVVLPVLVGMAWLVTQDAERETQRAASNRTRPVNVTRADRTETFTPAAQAAAFDVSESPPVVVHGTTTATAPVAAAEPRPVAAAAASPTDDPRLIDLVELAAQQRDAADIKTYYPRMKAAAAEERNRSVDELAASGSGGSQWLDHFRRVEEDWLAIDNRQGFGIELDEWVCFKAGCTITMRAPSLELIEQFSAFARDAAGMHEWRGEEHRSEPIQADSGEIEATWIFYAPPG